MSLITRYESGSRHGWYLGSNAEVVLQVAEEDAWPGIFAAFCRLRGLGWEDFEFATTDEREEFLRDIQPAVSDDSGIGSRSRA